MPFPQFPISLQFIGRSLQPPKDGGSSQSSLCRVCVLQVAGHVHVDGKSPNLPIRHTSGRIYSASFSRLQPVMLGTETVGISSRVAVNRAAPKYIRISLPGTKLFPMSPSYRKQQLLDSASSDYLAPKNLFPPQCAWFSSALHKCERTHRMQSEQQLFHEATCRYSSCEPELQGLLVTTLSRKPSCWVSLPTSLAWHEHRLSDDAWIPRSPSPSPAFLAPSPLPCVR